MVATAFRSVSPARRSTAHPPGEVSRLVSCAGRWLRADSRDVVRFARRTAPAPHPPAPSPSRGEGEYPRSESAVSPLPLTPSVVGLPPSAFRGGQSLDLHAGLSAWQGIMARWRLVAVLRRWAIVALTLALLLAVPGRLSAGLPAWIIAGVPAVLLVAGVVLAARRPPSLTAVARVLDHHLALKEQVASALALSGSADAHGPLGARLEARAAALIGRARREWRARPTFAGGEWMALVAVSAVAALLLIAPRPALSRPAALPTGVGPASAAFGTGPSRTHLPVQMRVAVVSTPPHRGVAPGTRSEAAAAAGGTTASTSHQHGNLPLVSGRPGSTPTGRGVLHTPGGRNGAGSSRGGQGRPAAGGPGQIQATQRGRAAGAGQRGSSPASGATGREQPGTIARGKGSRSPYGGPLPDRGVQQKPGLVTGKARYAGSAHGPGSNSAGHGRAALGGPSAGRPLHATEGHQLSLQSAYGGAPGQATGDRRQASVAGGQRGNAAHVVSGQSEASAADYIPPDANAVAPGDRAVVAGYFTPPSTP